MMVDGRGTDLTGKDLLLTKVMPRGQDPGERPVLEGED